MAPVDSQRRLRRAGRYLAADGCVVVESACGGCAASCARSVRLELPTAASTAQPLEDDQAVWVEVGARGLALVCGWVFGLPLAVLLLGLPLLSPALPAALQPLVAVALLGVSMGTVVCLRGRIAAGIRPSIVERFPDVTVKTIDTHATPSAAGRGQR